MRDFFQGGGVDVLFWIINAMIGIAVFMARNRQGLYEKMIQKDIDRLEKSNVKMEAELKEYRDFLERRLKDGTVTMRELVRSVETLKMEEAATKSSALPIPEFKVYCKEHENVHHEQARSIQNILIETGEVKKAITGIDSYVKGGFQTIMKLLGQNVVVGSAEKKEI
jgi:hypothetical protein